MTARPGLSSSNLRSKMRLPELSLRYISNWCHLLICVKPNLIATFEIYSGFSFFSFGLASIIFWIIKRLASESRKPLQLGNPGTHSRKLEDLAKDFERKVVPIELVA